MRSALLQIRKRRAETDRATPAVTVIILPQLLPTLGRMLRCYDGLPLLGNAQSGAEEPDSSHGIIGRSDLVVVTSVVSALPLK